MFKSLKKEGEIIIDCQGIPGDLSIACVPEKTYAGARGMCFLPSKKCLEIWIRKAGFSSQNCFYANPLTPCLGSGQK